MNPFVCIFIVFLNPNFQRAHFSIAPARHTCVNSAQPSPGSAQANHQTISWPCYRPFPPSQLKFQVTEGMMGNSDTLYAVAWAVPAAGSDCRS